MKRIALSLCVLVCIVMLFVCCSEATGTTGSQVNISVVTTANANTSVTTDSNAVTTAETGVTLPTAATTTSEVLTTTAELTTADITETSSVSTASSATTPITTVAPIEKGTDMKLLFTDADLCASAFDPQSDAEGKLVRYDRWYSTDYIEIREYYGFFYELGSHKYLMSLSFYDENKTYLSGIGTTSTSDASVITGFVIRPDNAVYARAVTFTGISTHNATSSAAITAFSTQASYDAECQNYPYRDLQIACIGDSLTEGDIGGYTPGVPDKKFQCYPYYLGKNLGCSVINYGKCGYTAQMILNMYRQGAIDISNADIILIMLGTNGGLRRNGATQYNSYLALLKAIKNDMKDGAKIILLTPPHASKNKPTVSADYYQNVKEAAETVFEIGKAQELYVIDIHNESPIQENMENIYQPNDGLHMVERGYQVLADYLTDKLIPYISIYK